MVLAALLCEYQCSGFFDDWRGIHAERDDFPSPFVHHLDLTASAVDAHYRAFDVADDEYGISEREAAIRLEPFVTLVDLVKRHFD